MFERIPVLKKWVTFRANTCNVTLCFFSNGFSHTSGFSYHTTYFNIVHRFKTFISEIKMLLLTGLSSSAILFGLYSTLRACRTSIKIFHEIYSFTRTSLILIHYYQHYGSLYFSVQKNTVAWNQF